MGKRPFTTVAALLFALAVLIHIYRLVTHFQIVAGSHTLPDTVSYVAIVFGAVMAWGLFRESRR